MGLIRWWRDRKLRARTAAVAVPVQAPPSKKPALPDELVILAEPLARSECMLISVEGTLNSTTASELEIRLQSLLADHRYRLVVDLARIAYISSRGWGVMISVLRDVRQNGGDIKISGMPGPIAHLFRQAGLASVFEAWPDPQQAAGAFAKT